MELKYGIPFVQLFCQLHLSCFSSSNCWIVKSHTLVFDYFVTLTWIVCQFHYVKLWTSHIAIWQFCHVDLDCLPTPLCQIEKSTMPNCDVHIPKPSTPHCYLTISFREVMLHESSYTIHHCLVIQQCFIYDFLSNVFIILKCITWIWLVWLSISSK
jgi:hypothetical protein